MNNILITWVSSGIGHFLAAKFQSEANIYWVSRRIPTDIKWNLESVDLADFKSLDDYADKLKNVSFDALIFNAWIWYFAEFEELSDEEIIAMMNLNSISPMLLLKKLVSRLPKNAKIIFIWSVSSKKFFNSWSVYQASKFALRWFAWSIRNELKQKVFLINPRIVYTDFFVNDRIWIRKNQDNETTLESIYDCVADILSWNESRFEIDL